MGIRYNWTSEKSELVRLKYNGTVESARELADLLKTTTSCVKNEVYRQGLDGKRFYHRGNSKRLWTQEDNDFLCEWAHKYSLYTLKRKLNRSVPAIVAQCKVLGIHRRYRDGWYCADEVAEGLGVSSRMIRARINDGTLKASRHNEHIWHISRKDLKLFIMNNLVSLTGRNVDLFFMVEVITKNGANNGYA